MSEYLYLISGISIVVCIFSDIFTKPLFPLSYFGTTFCQWIVVISAISGTLSICGNTALEIIASRNLKRSGVKVQGTILHCYIDKWAGMWTYKVVYSFLPICELKDAAQLQVMGERAVRKKLYNELQPGSPIEVRYDPRDASLNSIEEYL